MSRILSLRLIHAMHALTSIPSDSVGNTVLIGGRLCIQYFITVTMVASSVTASVNVLVVVIARRSK